MRTVLWFQQVRLAGNGELIMERMLDLNKVVYRDI